MKPPPIPPDEEDRLRVLRSYAVLDTEPGAPYDRLRSVLQRVRVDEETAVRHPDARAGSYVRLSVADTGTGISPEIRPQIFEPLFTTKSAGEGTGLGLATVYSIVRQHRGWLDVESEVGKGTTVHVYLP